MTKRKTKKKSKKQCSTVEVYKIKPPKLYSTYPYTSYDPTEVGTFATDLDRNVLNCDSKSFPKFASDIDLPIDLNVGLEEHYKQKEADKNRLQKTLPLWQIFLKWITISNFNVDSVDFIARRGILKFIGYTLYNYHKNPWSFKVCKHQGKVYMYEVDPEAHTNKLAEQSQLHKKYLYWGKKFEDCVTEPKEGVEDCYRMVSGKIGRYRVLLGSEIDAVRHDEGEDVEIKPLLQGCPQLQGCPLLQSCPHASSDPEYIEIKTCVKRQVRNKTSFGWLQSYLAGVQTLIFGFRDNEGIVDSIKEYDVSEVPVNCSWDAGAMFGLISGVLNWVYQHLEEGTSGTLLYLGDGKNEILLTKEEGHFLPDWFLSTVKNLGIKMDSVLPMEKQVIDLNKKSFRTLRNICKIRFQFLLTQDQLKTIVNSLVV